MATRDEALARWASRYGVPEVYAFERCASSHGATAGIRIQVWRLADGPHDWFTWRMETSFFDEVKDSTLRIDRGAKLGARRWSALRAALDTTQFWSDDLWPEEGHLGTDGQTWLFAGVRVSASANSKSDVESRTRAVWSPRDGRAVELARAFLSARPSALRWPRFVTLSPL